MDAYNPYYTAAVDKMKAQINYLEELLGRNLTPSEKDNIHSFFYSLNPAIQDKFEEVAGPLL